MPMLMASQQRTPASTLKAYSDISTRGSAILSLAKQNIDFLFRDLRASEAYHCFSKTGSHTEQKPQYSTTIMLRFYKRGFSSIVD